MKRGKDDEKILEPLFPRLHVNDTDKGGPRAPPRNKMALYEQLSIPSQRFNHQGTLNASNTGSLVPGPSNQACGMERNLYYQHQVSASALAQPAEKFVAQKPCMENVKSLAGHDQRKIVGEEDDLMVPVFLNSKRVQSHDRTKSEMNKENPSCVVLTSCNRSVEIQEVNSKDPKQNGSLSASSRQVVTELARENPRRGAMISTLDLSARELINMSKSASKCDRIHDAHLRQEFRNRLVENGRKTVTRGNKDGVDSQLRGESHSGEGHSSPDEVSNDNEPCRRRTSATLKERNGEASDGVSETSMVDSISSTDISPDDVVGIIGQKRFWKARRAIANQQRVFAVQVFELHRLIKVQRLIAESPHLLVDDGTYLRKYSPESSPVKKLLSGEYGVKPFPRVAKNIDDSEKDNHHKMECSAENAVGRTSVSSGKNLNNNHHHPPSNYMPVVSAASETQMTATSGGGGGGGGGGSWCFPPQPPPGNHQWLIPVMSPSEGLIYKPYTTPGTMGSGCGGYYSHFMPAPMGVSNFMAGPVYGLPAPPPYHPGVGFPSPGPGYFPPYAMPTMNPNLSSQHQQHQEQMNQFGIPNPPFTNMNTQQSSCNFPSSNNNANVAAATQTQQQQRQQLVAKPRPRNRESSRVVQGSTGSSPGDRGGSGNITGIFGKAFPLFPAAPATDNSCRNEQLLTTTTTTATTTGATMPMPPTTVETRVIRVVPHNPKAASESAARIFRSIQEGRKQSESSV